MYSATPGIALEILVDEELRRGALDAELLRETERAHAVDEPEIHRLDVATLFRRDFGQGNGEDLRRGRAMDVGAIAERAHERGVARKMRHDPQLDLRIVGGHDTMPRRRDERLADPTPLGRAHRDVLQIRIARREAPGHRGRLAERRVHAPGARIHHRGSLSV